MSDEPVEPDAEPTEFGDDEADDTVSADDDTEE